MILRRRAATKQRRFSVFCCSIIGILLFLHSSPFVWFVESSAGEGGGFGVAPVLASLVLCGFCGCNYDEGKIGVGVRQQRRRIPFARSWFAYHQQTRRKQHDPPSMVVVSMASSKKIQPQDGDDHDKNAETIRMTLLRDDIDRRQLPRVAFHEKKNPPLYYVAVITEPDCCDNDEKLERTFRALQQATSRGEVDLISIRVPRPNRRILATNDSTVNSAGRTSRITNYENDVEELQQRIQNLTQRLLTLSTTNDTNINSDDDDNGSHNAFCFSDGEHQFSVVLSSDWIQTALECRAHGVHVKESHRHLIPSIREQWHHRRRYYLRHSPSSSSSAAAAALPMRPRRLLIGTSAHSVESALNAWDHYQPDYYFVGTCYMTKSHPEKTSQDDLEGPALPGQVARALSKRTQQQQAPASLSLLPRPPLPPPPVLAIGGIEPNNCAEPIRFGAQGVATIRVVLQALDPGVVVHQLQQLMRRHGGKDI